MRRIPRPAKASANPLAVPDVDRPLVAPGAPVGQARPLWMFSAVLFLSLLMLGTYARVYDAQTGWTRLDGFGAGFADRALPRVKRLVHATVKEGGQDGQFYAQLAIDPSVRDPAFDQALDNPTYRARRIGLPTMAFVLGWAKPRRIIQAYALSNLIFWFVMAGAMVSLSRPWTGKQVMCVTAGLVGFGTLTSMEWSFVDLPATALIFVGLLAHGRWGKYGAFAVATLTRETSVLAAVGCLEWPRPLTAAVWKRNAGLLAVAALPFAFWMVYLTYRFHHLGDTTGSSGNFAWPLQAMATRLRDAMALLANTGLTETAKAAGPFGWLYADESVHEVLAIVALFFQGVYLLWRREANSPVWRTGVCFAALGCILGPDVWGWTAAAARVLLPMTVCFYLRLARERDAWFAPFFVLGSLSIPFALSHFCAL